MAENMICKQINLKVLFMRKFRDYESEYGNLEVPYWQGSFAFYKNEP